MTPNRSGRKVTDQQGKSGTADQGGEPMRGGLDQGGGVLPEKHGRRLGQHTEPAGRRERTGDALPAEEGQTRVRRDEDAGHR